MSVEGDAGAHSIDMLVSSRSMEKKLLFVKHRSTHTEKKKNPPQQISIPFWHIVLINLQWE